MNIFQKGWMMALTVAGFMSAGTPAAQAQEEKPIITFKTNIYDTQGAQNAFSIMLGTTETDYYDIDCGIGMEEQEVSPVQLVDGSWEGKLISCTVTKEGLVKIYGDASKIAYFFASGCYIDWIEMDDCVNLEILDLSHNELKRLDLTPFSNLQAVYLSDNTFTAETPLKIGGNKPGLQFLEIDIVDHLDQSFNLSDYPALISFDAYHCVDLRKVDPTGCPDLMVMSLELTQVASLDVSKNTELIRLNISDTRISSIDISRNTKLQNFHGQHSSGTINTDVKLKSLDVTNNPSLYILDVAGNEISSIDLSKNPAIQNLNLSRNNLSSIDLSANTGLYSVNLAYNDLDFVSLPLPQSSWGEYYYFRSPMECEKSYALGSAIDFSARVCREGTTTTARVWKDPLSAEPSLLDEGDYTYADGKVTFNAIPADSVYIEFINSAFPEYTITSGKFKVKNADEIGKPSKVLGLTFASAMAGKPVAFKVGMDNASASTPKTFYVDFGDGELHPYTATTIGVPAGNNFSVTLPAAIAGAYGIYLPEGESLTAFEMKDATLSSIDLSAATELRWLTVSNTNLSSIDLSTNRCLQTLDISGNRLSNLSLAGVYGDYEKNVLTDIDASSNRIARFEVKNVANIHKLNLRDNRLTTLSLKDYDALEELDLGNNRLNGEINLSYLANARTINLRGNSISSLVTVDMPALTLLDVADNSLTLETLPYIENVAAGVYVYAPQHDLVISENAPGVNLSAQNRVLGGVGTTFTWKKADGTVLVEGVDMTCNGGATRFLNADLGSVYCEMTNPAFPDLAGENVFKTTGTVVKGAPTTVVARFTTLENSNTGKVIFTGSKTSDLYIDWRGDGTEYIQYPINGDSYTAYPDQTTYAGAEVTVYTYESPADIKVFSVYDIAMGRMDASPMTNLTAFSVGGAGLTEENLVFPDCAGILKEINVSDNAFSTMDFKGFPNLEYLVISGNRYETFDASGLNRLQSLVVCRNDMTSLKFGGNNSLWSVDATDNKLDAISFEGAPMLRQVVIPNNNLHTIDLSPIKGSLVALDIQHNCFDFSTLPVKGDFPRLSLYRFVNQAPLEVACVDGKVDLSSQAMVGGTATEYLWFLGDVTYDSDAGTLVGELLDGESDDPEYMVENGVTTFNYTFTDKVMCVMTNSAFDGLLLYTLPVTVDKAGVEAVSVDRDDAPVDVYSISGIKLRDNVAPADATRGLAPGLYIVGGRKVLVK